MRFRFKQTWRGCVLEVEDRRPLGYPGEWHYYWRRAKPEEADRITIQLKGDLP